MNTPYTENASGRKYGDLTLGEKWKWHANVYAFRRVVLGISPDVRTSPCDETGRWFDDIMVAEEERKMIEKLIHESRRMIVENRRLTEKNFMPYWEMAAAGRRVSREWAQNRGHADFRGYFESRGLNFDDDYDYAVACEEVASSIIAAGAETDRTKFREKRGKYRDRHEAAAALGVTAREYDPEALRRGRIELKLEQSEAAE